MSPIILTCVSDGSRWVGILLHIIPVLPEDHIYDDLLPNFSILFICLTFPQIWTWTP